MDFTEFERALIAAYPETLGRPYSMEALTERILARGPVVFWAVVSWLASIRESGARHAEDLMTSVRGQYFENADIRDLLRDLVASGVIVKIRFSPSGQQRFFDVNASLRATPNLEFLAWVYGPGPNA